MTRRFQYLMLLLSAILLSTKLMAVPARGRVTLEQPDGSRIEALLRGDEFLHVLTDLQGHSLVRGEDGYYCYARYGIDGIPLSTGYRVGEPAPWVILSGSSYVPYPILALHAAAKRESVARLRQAHAAAARGNRPLLAPGQAPEGPVRKHCIVLLAEFSDVKMHFDRNDFVGLVTAAGYDYNGAEGSVLDYYNAQLGGVYSFAFDVGPLVTLDGTQRDYGRHQGRDNDADPAGLVAEACVKSHELGIDFSRYDDDEDGEVDNVFVMVAGKDEAEGGGEDCIWSHQWYLYEGAGIDLVLDGKRINSYAMSTELGLDAEGAFAFTSIGSFCHEFGHTLGLMDMYDTDYEGSGGNAQGLWGTLSLMDSGCYNNGGNTPPNFTAVDYDMLGTGMPQELAIGTWELEPIGENRRFFRMETGVEGEYYLFECRNNQEGWDRFIGGKGLLIYHIDKSNRDAGYSDQARSVISAAYRWPFNEINCRPDHQCADLIEAVPQPVSRSQLFFPGDGITAFTTETDPAFLFWDGTPSPLALTNIAQAGERVSFRVSDTQDALIPNVTGLTADVFQDAAILQWAADRASFQGTAVVSWGPSGSEQGRQSVLAYEDGLYALTIEGLSPRTAYTVTVYFDNDGISGPSEQIHFTTRSMYDDGIPFIFLTNLPRQPDQTFPAGTQLPLRVYNLPAGSTVEWFFSGRAIQPAGNGYYPLVRSGTLKAHVSYPDGGTDDIIKEITVS